MTAPAAPTQPPFVENRRRPVATESGATIPSERH